MKIVGVAACITGVAHTYMAQEAIEQECKKRGYDVKVETQGGMGIAAGGNINPEGVYPSMFEPVHGSAPDIAGQGIADPIAAIASVVLLLQNAGLDDQAERVQRAIDADMAWRAEHPDLARERGTKDVGAAVLAKLN